MMESYFCGMLRLALFWGGKGSMGVSERVKVEELELPTSEKELQYGFKSELLFENVEVGGSLSSLAKKS